jgi:CDP-glucose 4,6-dehydratase
MQREFWQGKRVFVTGHTGFKGGWLSLWLRSMGAEVAGYSLAPNTDPNLFELAEVARGVDSRFADIRSLATLRAAMQETRPEIVLHLAAQPLVRESYQEPIVTFETNVLGTANVLEAARSCDGLRVFVSVTTDKCYRNPEQQRGFVEDDPLGGKDPYSSSKAGAELVTAAYRDSFFASARDGNSAAVATARAGNVIGGGDWAEDRLVPDLLRGFAAGKATLIRSPDAVRPWQHVLEPLRGYLTLAERLWRDGEAFASAWNFGPDPADERPVRWIADRMVELWGDDAAWTEDANPHPPEAHYLKLDCAKAHRELAWRPALPLEDGLAWTVSWHRELARGAGARALAEDQIAAYEERLALR